MKKNSLYPFYFLSLIIYLFSEAASGQCFTGRITSDAYEVCSGSGVTLDFSLSSNQTGGDENLLSVFEWQYSYTPDNAGSWNTMPVGTVKTVSAEALNRNVSYRVRYQYDACANQYANIAITVHSPSVGGVLQGNADVCESANSGIITLSGQTGSINQWYKRDAYDPDWVPVAGSGADISYSDLLLTTLYRVEVQNGVCPSAFSGEATVTVHPNPALDFTASLTCDGSVTRFSNQSAISEGFISNYLWQFGDGSQSTQFNPQKQYYNPDTYMVTLTAVSNRSCAASVTRAVTVHPNPISSFTVMDVCTESSMQFINTSTVRSGENMTYTWEFGDDVRSSLSSPDYRYSAPGTYRVKMIAVTSTGLCRDSVERDVTVFPLPNAFAGRDTTISSGHGAILRASGGVSYSWSPPDGLSNSMVYNPVAKPEQNTLYTVTVTDANGCVNTAGVNVFVNSDFSIHPYNVITPDGNGENDVWIVEHIERYPNAHVRIINRWGEEVFLSQNYTNANGWNGFNKNGDILPEGTYYYIITLEGENKVYRGAITLLRK